MAVAGTLMTLVDMAGSVAVVKSTAFVYSEDTSVRIVVAGSALVEVVINKAGMEVAAIVEVTGSVG